ncbi:MAG: hypothetical protein BRD32_00915 [Bacteroidetes bacterium QH_2_64_74]|nr:MAG: hypothetical protein BRD32_00915 [Bacteroidetes bacterium QH_2_64_74]
MDPRASIRPVLDRMVQRLADEYAPERIVLFGSHAAGTADADSDIDLLIVKDTSERFLDRWTTVQRLLTGLHFSIPVETLHFSIPVETIVLTPTEVETRIESGDAFLHTILDQGEILYES